MPTMGRRRRGQPIHGWIVVDKPGGLSSSAVVGQVRRRLRAAKAGHGGTLDPIATGVLPVALGEATKTVSYLMEGIKVYRFVARWGEARNTDDVEGRVIETSPVRPAAADIEAAVDGFVGEIDQVPPNFSAVKVHGRRAYDLARRGHPVVLQPRRVHIHRLELVSVPDADHAVLEAACGKGTYMRSLVRDLARVLGTVAHVEQLRRLAVGPFTEAQSISLDKLGVLMHSAPPGDYLLPVEAVLADIPALRLTEAEARRLRHGQPVPVLPVASRSPLRDVGQGDIVRAEAEGRLVALARIKGGEIRPVRVINL